MERLEELKAQALQLADKICRPNIDGNYLTMLTQAKSKISNEIRDLELQLESKKVELK